MASRRRDEAARFCLIGVVRLRYIYSCKRKFLDFLDILMISQVMLIVKHNLTQYVARSCTFYAQIEHTE